jgi:hypothetical protein
MRYKNATNIVSKKMFFKLCQIACLNDEELRVIEKKAFLDP